MNNKGADGGEVPTTQRRAVRFGRLMTTAADGLMGEILDQGGADERGGD